MATIAILTKSGEGAKKVDLNPTIFESEVNHDLIAQAIRIRMYNAWLGTRKTKSRGEVSGGGRKPWRQKGTGRARHGSIRSPIWVGGGHTHPLRPVDKSLKFPKKMRRKALFAALSAQYAQDGIAVIEDVEIKKPNTKEALTLVSPVKDKGKVLLVLSENNIETMKSFKNLKKVRVMEARLLHPYDILHSDIVVFTPKSLEALEQTFVK